MKLRGHAALGMGIGGALVFFLACGNDSGGSGFDTGGDGGGDAISSDAVGFGETGVPTCNPCNDFLADPILDGPSDGGGGEPVVGPAPPSSATLFGAAGSPTGGPCMFEPEVGTLFPNNWLRARFR